MVTVVSLEWKRKSEKENEDRQRGRKCSQCRIMYVECYCSIEIGWMCRMQINIKLTIVFNHTHRALCHTTHKFIVCLIKSTIETKHTFYLCSALSFAHVSACHIQFTSHFALIYGKLYDDLNENEPGRATKTTKFKFRQRDWQKHCLQCAKAHIHTYEVWVNWSNLCEWTTWQKLPLMMGERDGGRWK